jgi:hypothetical protein
MPSRLATLKRAFIYRGFSSEISELIAKPQRESTIKLYQSRWEQFLAWCKSIKKHPAQCDLVMFMNYLIHLFQSGLGPDAIKGHRSAIGPIFNTLGLFDSTKDSHLTLLMRRFKLEKPRVRISMPKWNLSVVLCAFMRSPFVNATSGSDRDVELKWLTVKAVFLVALACGRRVSCIRSLQWDFTISRGNDPYQQVCTLRTLPEFRAKNQRSSDLSPSVVIPGMAHLVPRDPERFLCPVRTLRLYAHRTARLHRGIKRLFVHWVDNKAEITTGHISRWVMLAVKTAYESVGQTPPVGISAHELRALAASWAYRRHVPLEDIKEALYWRSNGIFQDHYLRDMSAVAEGMSRLGPVVVAGSII